MREASEGGAGEGGAEVVPITITTGEGMRLAADIAGEPWRPRVIFIHGGGQSRRSWRRAISRMAAAGFSVVSYDLRGHGESDWARDGDYSLDAHVRDLAAVVANSRTPPALVGASLGGRVALETAARLGTDAIRTLVMVDITPRVAEAGISRLVRFLEVSRDGFESVEQAAAVLERYAERAIGGNYFRLAHSITVGPQGRIFWRWDPRMAEPAIMLPPGMEERLTASARRLACPTLLVRGSESDIVTDDCVAHFRAVMPDARVVDIPGAGHLMKTAHLSVFCDATTDFLRGGLDRVG